MVTAGSELKRAPRPCAHCPWRVSTGAADIPQFDFALAHAQASCCPDSSGMGPEFGAPFFACHKSKDSTLITCAGWLAAVGARHPGVRLAILMNRLDARALRPDGLPPLHASFKEMMEKLTETGFKINTDRALK